MFSVTKKESLFTAYKNFEISIDEPDLFIELLDKGANPNSIHPTKGPILDVVCQDGYNLYILSKTAPQYISMMRRILDIGKRTFLNIDNKYLVKLRNYFEKKIDAVDAKVQELLPKAMNLQIARAKKLIELGAEIGKDFPPEARAWARSHCRETIFLKSASSFPQTVQGAQIETMLPIDWVPPSELNSSPIQNFQYSNPKLFQESNRCAKIFHGVRDTLRPLVSLYSSHPLCMLTFKAIAYTGIPFLVLNQSPSSTTLTVISIAALSQLLSFATSLTHSDVKRIHDQALTIPLYEHIWETVCKEGPLTIKPRPAFDFRGLLTPLDDWSRADWNGFQREIRLFNGLSENKAFKAIIFETINAYQDKSFKILDKQILSGLLEKEEFVRRTEWVEHQTGKIANEIFYMAQKSGFRIRNFEENWVMNWEIQNIRSTTKRLDSHSDYYRKVWDRIAVLYYLRNPQKAPQNDWVNQSINFDTPLEVISQLPETAVYFSQDPFYQLLDKGAKTEGVLKQICKEACKSFCSPNDKAVHGLRAKKLLDLNVSTDDLSKSERQWLSTL